MKNNIFAALFPLILLASFVAFAQQSHNMDAKNILYEQSERRHFNFDISNGSTNPPHHLLLNVDITTLNAFISDFQVNDDQEGTYHLSPSISTNSSGNFVITWYDDRKGDYTYDIYAQRFSNDGTTLGTNFKVNDNQGIANQTSPSISIDNIGNFVITWVDTRNEWQNDIYAQRFSNDGTTIGANFKVNDDQGNANQTSPSISIDGSSNFVITWEDSRNEGPGIYAQRYSSTGTALGTNFRINDGTDDPGWFGKCHPSISLDDSGNFVITWTMVSGFTGDIYAQRYSSNGNKLGTNFKVNDDLGNADQRYPSISTDSSGNFVITWVDASGIADLFAQRYSSDGNKLGTNFQVNERHISVDNDWYPSISTDSNGNFVITWGNGGLEADIYAQRYSSDGIAVDTNFRITNTSNKSQLSPDVSLWNNRIYNTWIDNRAGGTGGHDIWANVLDWENPISVEDKKLYQLPTEFILSQNYPNPFNASTNISYSIPKSDYVILKIYDLIGREIKSAVNEFQKAGNYVVNIEASQLSSGIYFYRMQVGNDFIEIKKMMFLK